MKILFCNIGWMELYRGQSTTDKIVGGGSYVKDKGMGHEVCNFAPHAGMVYGYVQPPKEGRPGEGQIKIERIDGKNSDFVENVLVIWTATRPKVGSVVVGWYKSATVYRCYQHFHKLPPLHKKNNLGGYRIKAKSSDVTLLPVDERTCSIPRRIKGGMGQSNVWFADAPEATNTVARIKALVEGKRTPKPVAHARKTDPEHNAKVEKAAVATIWKYYKDLGYLVESVERDNVGWDIEATLGKTKLRIEVKGLSGTAANAQLTPNEFDAFSASAEDYRLAIVTEAISSPRHLICRYSCEQDTWLVDGEASCQIDIERRESAVVKVRT